MTVGPCPGHTAAGWWRQGVWLPEPGSDATSCCLQVSHPFLSQRPSSPLSFLHRHVLSTSNYVTLPLLSVPNSKRHMQPHPSSLNHLHLWASFHFILVLICPQDAPFQAVTTVAWVKNSTHEGTTGIPRGCPGVMVSLTRH